MSDHLGETKQYNYRVFSERAAKGNLASVLIPTNDTSITSAELANQLSYRATENQTYCYLSQIDNNPSVSCFSPHGEIKRCGHGALASAAHLDTLGLLHPSATLNYQIGHFFIRKYKGCYWLSSDSEIEVTSVNTTLASNLVETEILETSESMGKNGYLIIRLADNTDLKQIEPDLALLERNTGQALIITSYHSNQADFDYQLRYFAPQYGVREDSATGSANEIAAYFWQPRLKKISMACYQASKAGGYIYANIEDNRLWIGGNVHQA